MTGGAPGESRSLVLDCYRETSNGRFQKFLQTKYPLSSWSNYVMKCLACSILLYLSLRDRSTTLPDDERKAFAEKVAMQFYNAIGGEDNCGEEECKNNDL